MTKKTATARPVAVPPPEPEPQPRRILGRDDGNELNPAIVDEIEPNQRAALEVAAHRLQEYPAETVRRLVGLALFLTGLDPAGEDEATEVLCLLLGDEPSVAEPNEKLNALVDRFLSLQITARDLSIRRERLDRAHFLERRQDELKRLRGQSSERFEREIGTPARARLAAGA
jgi:hypothetical protein